MPRPTPAVTLLLTLVTLFAADDLAGATLEAKFLASDAEAGDRFGEGAAIAADVAAVGASGEDEAAADAGAVYVFVRDADGAWSEVAKRTAGDAGAGDALGSSVATDGETVAAGAPQAAGGGAVYLFGRDQGGDDAWGLLARLDPPVGAEGDLFGFSVAVDGDLALVGAPEHDGRGTAWLFQRDPVDPTAWTPIAELDDPDGLDGYEVGTSVTLDGGRAAVGGPWARACPMVKCPASGIAFLFERDAGGPDAWGLVEKLRPESRFGGDELGTAVDLDGDRLAAGAPGDCGPSGACPEAGVVWVFERRSDGPWERRGPFTPEDDGELYRDRFGQAIAVVGDLVVGGAPEDDSLGLLSGSAHLVERSSLGRRVWRTRAELPPDPDDRTTGDEYGTSLGLVPGRALVGSPGEEEAAGEDSGAAYVFDLAPVLALDGRCPEPTTVGLSHVTPDARVALLGSARRGDGEVPAGGCAGTPLGLADPAPLAAVTVDGAGRAEVFLADPSAQCGAYLQAIDLASCQTSAVERLDAELETIRYDPGAPADFFRVPSSTSESLGNVFDSFAGSPLASGSLHGFEFLLETGQYFNGVASFTLWPAPPADGGPVDPVANFRLTNVDTYAGTLQTYLLAEPVEVGPSFVLGMYVGVTCSFGCIDFGSPGLRSATTGGQGFHAMRVYVEDAGSPGTGFTSVAANAMIRARGDFGDFGGPLLPVELMPSDADAAGGD